MLESEFKIILELCRSPKTIAELMQATHRENRTKFRQKFIAVLLDKGLLRMTISEKPQSSKQQYLTTEAGIKLLEVL